MEKKKISWKNIDNCINILAKKLKPYVKRGTINNVYGVIRGGIIPAIMLSHKLNINYSEYVDKKTVIIDDIEDSGKTAEHHKEQYQNNFFVVLFNKRDVFDCDFYAKKENSKKWLVFPWEVK